MRTELFRRDQIRRSEPDLERCLSCEQWTLDGPFCDECLERSKQRFLIPEIDDLGVAG